MKNAVIEGLSKDPSEAYEQGRRDGRAESIQAAEAANRSSPGKPIDLTSKWYKNCRRRRKEGAKICQSCPFKTAVEPAESSRPYPGKPNKDYRRRTLK